MEEYTVSSQDSSESTSKKRKRKDSVKDKKKKKKDHKGDKKVKSKKRSSKVCDLLENDEQTSDRKGHKKQKGAMKSDIDLILKRINKFEDNVITSIKSLESRIMILEANIQMQS